MTLSPVEPWTNSNPNYGPDSRIIQIIVREEEVRFKPYIYWDTTIDNINTKLSLEPQKDRYIVYTKLFHCNCVVEFNLRD